MSTKSIIARKINDKKSLAIYCHYDGYLEHNGVILQEYYNTPEKVIELINNGDLYWLRKNLNPNPNKEHSYINPQKDACFFYGRDMKYKNTKPKVLDTKKLGQKYAWTEHVYLYDTNQWFHSYVYEKDDLHFKPLKTELELVQPNIDLMKKMKTNNEPPSLE